MGNAETAGVDNDLDVEPTGVDFDTKPTGVEVEADHGNVHDPVPQEQVEMHQGDGMEGLGQQVPTPARTTEPTAESTDLRQSSRLTKKWKQSYIPSYKGTK